MPHLVRHGMGKGALLSFFFEIFSTLQRVEDIFQTPFYLFHQRIRPNLSVDHFRRHSCNHGIFLPNGISMKTLSSLEIAERGSPAPIHSFVKSRLKLLSLAFLRVRLQYSAVSDTLKQLTQCVFCSQCAAYCDSNVSYPQDCYKHCSNF